MNKKNIVFNKICEHCNTTFSSLKSTTKFCSQKCASAAYKVRKRKERIDLVEQEFIVKQTLSPIERVKDKEFLTPTDAGILLGIGRSTIYRYLRSNELKGIQLKGKTLIRRSDIETLFDNASTYVARAKKIEEPITDFYTMIEIKATYDVKEVWVYKIVRENNIPKVLRRGKSYFSKKHIDNYFAKKTPDINITEWYSVADIKNKYNLSLQAIYTFTSENKIPKKKKGRIVFYSQKHFDIAKGYEEPEKQKYYTVKEATVKFGITREALYSYIKSHNIPKIKDGKYINISKVELDKLFATPIIE